MEEPGITLLDIRIALRVEKLWEKYLENGKAILPPPGISSPGYEIRTIVGYGLKVQGLRENNHSKSERRAVNGNDDP